jgi:ATP-dependent DNA helicase RecG
MDDSPLKKEIQYVKGVGPQRSIALGRLNIKTVEDLLYYAPREWVDRSNIKPISKVRPGELETVCGIVAAKQTQKIRFKLSLTKVVIQDRTGYITAVWYNQPYMEKVFNQGDEVIFNGKVEFYRGNLQMNTPEYEVTSADDADAVNVNRIVPIYALTESVTQKQFRKIIKYTLDNYLKFVEEYMPEEIRRNYSLRGLNESVYGLHYPSDFSALEQFKKRIIFDEFFFLQLALALRRKNVKEKKGIIFNINGDYKTKFREALPFKLTKAQRRVVEEIKADVSSGRPMNRLLQGDVGSGKTVVALIAAVIARDSGFQCAIMAPTEILAGQHFTTVTKLLETTGIKAVLLTGGPRSKQKKETLKLIESGEADIIIGTHALIQDDVIFRNLGLIIIDEQHRFGVLQRAALARKADQYPHTLIMTATPIPRTLSMTVYGDTDVSIIDELPPGRKPVHTVIFEDNKKYALFDFVEARLKEGSQVYAVYPLVAESEKLDLKSAVEMEKQWAARFKDYKVDIIHGQMKKEDRDRVMADFKDKKVAVLVATTVIEVGIDVPNAAVIVIEHAERFGLSQLHQLRGRVGRGEKQSYCILVGDPTTEDGMKRLAVMTSTSDGFKISEEDLAIRGPGEFMGTRQHGLHEFRVADIIKDRNIMELSRQAALWITSPECDLDHIAKEELIDRIRTRYGDSFNLINVG